MRFEVLLTEDANRDLEDMVKKGGFRQDFRVYAIPLIEVFANQDRHH